MNGSHSKALNWYSLVVVGATFFLIFIGAMVTTRDAGLSVPDWPLSFGSINPPQYLQDVQVFWEHSHRLVGATVGLLVIGLAVWLTLKDRRKWVKILGWAVLAAVILQGVLGGLRVWEKSLTFAILHGCLAQAVLCSMFLVFIVTSATWFRTSRLIMSTKTPALRVLSIAFLLAVYGQLVIGALMRHHKAGLAIPVFPKSTLDGAWIPSSWNFGIAIHFTHRVWALVIVVLALALAGMIWRHFSRCAPLRKAAVVILSLLGVQVLLGAHIIWHFRPFTLTTLHVVNGAAILGAAFYTTVYALSLQGPGPLVAETERPTNESGRKAYS
jgi:cytochrome c oxidase assembly protein subunit 15